MIFDFCRIADFICKIMIRHKFGFYCEVYDAL